MWYNSVIFIAIVVVVVVVTVSVVIVVVVVDIVIVSDRKQKGVEEKSHVSNRSTIKNWYDDEQDADYHDQQSDDYSFYEQYLAYYVELGDDEKMTMGHSLRDMMLSCSYNGRRCSPRSVKVKDRTLG